MQSNWLYYYVNHNPGLGRHRRSQNIFSSLTNIHKELFLLHSIFRQKPCDWMKTQLHFSFCINRSIAQTVPVCWRKIHKFCFNLKSKNRDTGMEGRKAGTVRVNTVSICLFEKNRNDQMDMCICVYDVMKEARTRKWIQPCLQPMRSIFIYRIVVYFCKHKYCGSCVSPIRN